MPYRINKDSQNAKSQALDGPLDASSTVDGRSDTCPNPGPSFDTHSPGNQRGPGHKKPHRRGTRLRTAKKTSQPAEGLPENSPTAPKAQREAETEVWTGDKSTAPKAPREAETGVWMGDK